MVRALKLLAILTLVGVAGLLSGCATTRMIDTEVKSFVGSPPAPRNATYRFERLPSQQGALDQNVVEAMTAKALAKAGAVLTPDHPDYSMQVTLQMLRLPRDPRYDPWMSGYGRGSLAMQVGIGMGPFYETLWYRNSVQLVLRDLHTNSVAFESKAIFESPWPDSVNIVPVMLEAALQGFPTPPPGSRVVPLELPSKDVKN